jgi:hypothetical protein
MSQYFVLYLVLLAKNSRHEFVPVSLGKYRRYVIIWCTFREVPRDGRDITAEYPCPKNTGTSESTPIWCTLAEGIGNLVYFTGWLISCAGKYTRLVYFGDSMDYNLTTVAETLRENTPSPHARAIAIAVN